MAQGQSPRPKTLPTGFAPRRRKLSLPCEVPPGTLLTLEDAALCHCYERERSRWESLRAGRSEAYRAPRSYAGTEPKLIDGEAVLEKGRRSEWRALRTWCDSQEIPPLAYVQLIFEMLPHTLTRSPEPKDLNSGKYLSLWNHYAGKIVEKLSLALDFQQQEAIKAILVSQSLGNSQERANVEACTRGDLAISGLFRYCLATSIGTPVLKQIAQTAEPEAILQFMRHRDAYLEAWDSVLPEGFAALAEKRYPDVLLSFYGRR